MIISKPFKSGNFISDGYIDVHITRLRKAINRSSDTKFEAIKTIRSVG